MKTLHSPSAVRFCGALGLLAYLFFFTGSPSLNAATAPQTRGGVGTIAPAPTGCPSSTFSVIQPVNAPITDLNTTSDSIVISGLDPFIWDVDLITNITHTFPGDLDITLTSPAGTVMTLTTDNGSGADNVFNGTVWDDQAGDTVTDFPHVNGVTSSPLVPEEAMAAFVGEDPNGTWTLDVFDDANVDTGMLVSWGMSITTISSPPTTTNGAYSNGTDFAITDLNTVNSSILVSGADTFITDLNLITDITHTFPGDLDITLTSPAGTVMTLTTDNGSGADNVFNGTFWDDQAGDPVSDFPHVNGVTSTPLVPEGALAAFIGEDPNGTWTLTIFDDAAADTGLLDNWTLDITTGVCGVCAGATFTSLNGSTATFNYTWPGAAFTVNVVRSADTTAGGGDLLLDSVVITEADGSQDFPIGPADLSLVDDSLMLPGQDYYILAQAMTGTPFGGSDTAIFSGTYQQIAGQSVFVHGCESNDDNITASDDGVNLTVNLNGAPYVFPLANMTNLQVYTHGGNDTVNVSGHATPNFTESEAAELDANGSFLRQAAPTAEFQALVDRNAAPAEMLHYLATYNTIVTGDSSAELRDAVGPEYYDLIMGRGGLDCSTFGHSGNYFLGNGIDTFIGSPQNESVHGGAEADNLATAGGCDRLWGDAGNDTLDGGADRDTIMYNDTPSRVVVRLDLGETPNDGYDTFDLVSNVQDVFGSLFNDLILGDSQSNYLFGDAGNDELYGKNNTDLVQGGDGNDWLFGGDQDDVVQGQNGVDVVQGNAGSDWLEGNAGDDTLRGGANMDFMYGGANNDTVLGEDGDDRLSGNNDDDTVVGGPGADWVNGNAGNDTLYANTNACVDDGVVDLVYGEGGTDTAYVVTAGGTADTVGGVETVNACP